MAFYTREFTLMRSVSVRAQSQLTLDRFHASGNRDDVAIIMRMPRLCF
jgi:hypothetical protein